MYVYRVMRYVCVNVYVCSVREEVFDANDDTAAGCQMQAVSARLEFRVFEPPARHDTSRHTDRDSHDTGPVAMTAPTLVAVSAGADSAQQVSVHLPLSLSLTPLSLYQQVDKSALSL